MTPLDHARVVSALSPVDAAISYLDRAAARREPMTVEQMRTIRDWLVSATSAVDALPVEVP